MATHRNEIESLVNHLKDQYMVRDKTEAQAIALASSKPSAVFYTTDSHAIVVGGNIYGRGAEMAQAFMYANSTQDQGSWNQNRLYIVPADHVGEFNIWGYTSSNWYVVGTTSLNIATDASDIGYDATNSQLDADNVQNAIDEVVEEVSHKGKYIGGWVDDNILPNNYTTEYPEGSTIGAWATNASYGCRGVKLAVKEGDKLLLDTFSPMRYGLYFTDESLTVVSRLGDRRFDGVYTSPCDGYAYIIDVLYRENWIYDKAVGHLAYIAFDARKNTTFDKDYYNEYCPRILKTSLPLEVYKKPVNNDAALTLDSANAKSSILKEDGVVLVACHMYLGANNQQTAGGYSIGSSIYGASTQYAGLNIYRINSPTMQELISAGSNGLWAVAVLKNVDYKDSLIYVRIQNSSAQTSTYLHLIIDKMYLHTFDDVSEAIEVGNMIADGRLDVDNIHGGTYNITEPWMQAIGTTSVMGLGYNIFEKGAELPMDNEGFAYGMNLKGTAGKQFGGSTEANADQDLVYLPVMDWSGFTGSKSSVFKHCKNLITIPDIDWSASLTMYNETFSNCVKLKKVGNIVNAKVHCHYTFYNCCSLESVGNFQTDTVPSGQFMFYNCFNLKRIGTITFNGGVTSMLQMFNYCYKLETFPTVIPLASNATDLGYMFRGCEKLTDGTMPTFTLNGSTEGATANVTSMEGMFFGCKALRTLPVLDYTSVTVLRNFCAESGLIHAGDIDAPVCTSASYIFQYCDKLQSVGNIKTPLATSYYGIFTDCTSLAEVKSIDFSSVTDIRTSFSNCTSLVIIEIKNLGKSSSTSFDLRALTAWGSDSGEGLTSLKNTFINLYDRTSNGMSNATIRVAAAVYTRIQNNLSASEWASIAGKGYTLTNS